MLTYYLPCSGRSTRSQRTLLEVSLGRLLLELPQAERVALIKEDVLHYGALIPIIGPIMIIIDFPIFLALLDGLQLALDPLQGGGLAAVGRVGSRHATLSTICLGLAVAGLSLYCCGLLSQAIGTTSS